MTSVIEPCEHGIGADGDQRMEVFSAISRRSEACQQLPNLGESGGAGFVNKASHAYVSISRNLRKGEGWRDNLEVVLYHLISRHHETSPVFFNTTGVVVVKTSSTTPVRCASSGSVARLRSEFTIVVDLETTRSAAN